MRGVCAFCNQEGNLTKHHIVGRRYKGNDNPENLIPDICEYCHQQILEKKTDEARKKLGSGSSLGSDNFNIGNISACLNTGSTFLNENGQGVINVGSPVLAISIQDKIYGQRNLEILMSGATALFITGPNPNSWIMYSVAEGDKK
jgi:hypothetical protein